MPKQYEQYFYDAIGGSIAWEDSVRTKFSAYYRPLESDFERLWKKATFAFDSNVLLNLYSYSTQTSDEVLELLQAAGDRIWLPYQTALEYHKNRHDVIAKQVQPYDAIKKDLQNLKKQISEAKRHPFVSKDTLNKLTSVFDSVILELDERKDAIKGFKTADPIRDRLTELFSDRIGDQFSKNETAEIIREGQERYSKRIPPGYCDDAKALGNEKYGDLLIWKEILRHGKKMQRNVIFVTDDRKKDWWLMVGEDIEGPRPELLAEFSNETGCACYIYSSEEFVKYAKKHLYTVSEETLVEVKKASEERQKEAFTQPLGLHELLRPTGQYNELAAIRALLGEGQIPQPTKTSTIAPTGEYGVRAPLHEFVIPYPQLERPQYVSSLAQLLSQLPQFTPPSPQSSVLPNSNNAGSDETKGEDG